MSFFCLWIPQFAAWAHAQNEPLLSNTAFAVCNDGIISAVSPLAQASGIRAGMTSKKATSLLKSLNLVNRNLALEAGAWRDVQGALYELTPNIEDVQPGLLFAKVDARKTLPLLQNWQVHAGQASDRATAHLAALTGDRGEVRCVREGRESHFADRVPVETILLAGISSNALEQFKSLGWKSVGALRVLSFYQLEELIGSEAKKMYHLAQGPKWHDNSRPVSSLLPSDELVASVKFELPAREASEWESSLEDLLTRLHDDLGNRDARTLELHIETPIIPLSARRVLKSSTSTPELLQAPARDAMEEALQTLAPLPPVILSIEARLGTISNDKPQDVPFGCEETVEPERPSRWQGVLKGIESRLPRKSRVAPAGDTNYIQGILPLFPAEGAITVLEPVVEQKMRVVR